MAELQQKTTAVPKWTSQDASTAATGFTSIVGIATNAIQRSQEKERQERIDQYNKELNDRNFYAVQLQNSPSYQLQRLKDAGYNPLAQGITPTSENAEAGQTLSPTPMETSSVGNSMISAGQGVASAMIAEEGRAIERGELEVRQKQVDVEQAKVDLESKKMDMQQGLHVMETVLDLYKKGSIPMSACNEVCGRYGFQVVGRGQDAELVDAQIAKTRADTAKANEEAKKVKEETELVRRNGRLISLEADIKEFEKEWRSLELRQMFIKRGLEIDKLSAEIGGISINNERAQIAKDVEKIRGEIAKIYGSVDDVPMSERIDMIETVKEILYKTDYFHDKFMFLPSEDYRQFCDWMQKNSKDLAQQEYWAGWFNMLSNAVQAGATVYGASKIGQGLVRPSAPRIYTPEYYQGSPTTIPYRQ